jgi:hypothetical protein
MKTRITVGAALLLTLGSALAGGLIYQKDKPVESNAYEPSTLSVDSREVTPEMILKWKATAATSNYSPPMLPI